MDSCADSAMESGVESTVETNVDSRLDALVIPRLESRHFLRRAWTASALSCQSE